MASTSNLYPEAPPPYAEPPITGEMKYGANPASAIPAYQPQAENPLYVMTSGPSSSQPMIGQAHSATIVIGLPVYGSMPTNVTCPNCRQSVISVVNHRPGLLTWLLIGGLAIFGLWCGCCLIPLCVDDCQDVEHTCPNCRALLGTYKRL